MSLPQRITALLTSLTKYQLTAMPPEDARLLKDQCERVYREITVHRIETGARKATATRSGILGQLRDGERDQ